MLTPAEASSAIVAALAPIAVETVPLEAAAGRILAETLVAERDLPPFDRVAMDGIAVRHAAFLGGRRRFRVAGIVGAGQEPLPLSTEEDCLEVMTGAMLPPGADTVIPVEQITLEGGHASLRVDTLVAGANIHGRASDGRAGDVVLTPGMKLRAPELAVAASVGRATLQVSRIPHIAIVSTGDELVGAEDPIQPWQIRRSNVHGIAAQLDDRGYRHLSLSHITDDRGRLLLQIADLLANNDVLILSGGVSAGKFDHVPGVLAELGVRRIFHKVAQRPGKPLWFGVTSTGKPVFALPGNPVSTLVCLVRYVLPALEHLCGRTATAVPGAHLDNAWSGSGTLTAFIPVRRSGPGHANVELRPTRGSGDFVSLVGTDGFVELTPGAPLPPGSTVPFYTW
jgi:molybdopterin molybdotransferase